jgi:4-hydroxythreonine-4-phosphate dehydrogenase
VTGGTDTAPTRDLPRIALTLGDPAGIGPEIVLKTLLRDDVHAACKPILFGDDVALATHAMTSGLSISIDSDTIRVGGAPAVSYQRAGLLTAGMPPLAQPTPEAGRACHGYAVAAMRHALAGRCDAVVAAPHTEAAVNAAGIPFRGYPDLLAETTGTPAERVFLMLVSPYFRIVNVTLHEPLSAAISRLTVDFIDSAIGAAVDAMARFGIEHPSVAVCGLNPHAGEGGLFGHEDQAIIAPAISRWKHRGHDVSGPHPADAVLAKRAHDVYLAMYHDQGHIPVKVMSPNAGVAMSVGTPVLFSSVAHGSAYDIAGQGKADETALATAVMLVAEQFHKRAAV